MKFALVSDVIRPENKNWWIHIKTIEDLCEWYEDQTLIRDGMRDYFRRISKGWHPTSPIGSILEMYRSSPQLSQIVLDYGSDIIGLSKYLDDIVFRQKVEMLARHKTLLINPHGGYCPLDRKYHKLHTTIEADVFAWPDPKGEIKFMQWVKGGHWYVKVGSYDVVVEGEQKWNSKLEAEEALSKFLKGNP